MVDHKVAKVTELLEKHRAAILEQLGPSAFEKLTPAHAASLMRVETKRLPDLVREGWLDYVPDGDVGHAHMYYRWRVEFVRQYRKTRNKNIRNTPEN